MEEPMMLEQRIASAFAQPTSSAVLGRLIAEVEAAAIAANEAAQRARERALDPTTSAQELAQARQDSEQASFSRDRMNVALSKLSELMLQVQEQEIEAERIAAYEAAKAERDKLAAELKKVYPPLARQLASLVARIHANDEELRRINNKARPKGAEWLNDAEMVSRGLEKWNTPGGGEVPRIAHQLRLPAFKYEQLHRYTWPALP